MTAQQFWPKWIKDEGIWGGDAPVISKESGHRFADALSARNTAQAEKKYSDHIEDCLVATAADDALIAELRAALEVARNEKAMLLIELQKYHIAERLRSQGAGPWEAAALEIWQRFVATFPEVDAASEIGLHKVIAIIIAKHAGQERAIPLALMFKPFYATEGSDGICASCKHFCPKVDQIALSSSHHTNCPVMQAILSVPIRGLASPSEGEVFQSRSQEKRIRTQRGDERPLDPRLLSPEGKKV